MGQSTETAYELEPGQKVGCYVCMQSNHHEVFARGEAFLVEPGVFGDHAHYICKKHLPAGTEIYDTYK